MPIGRVLYPNDEISAKSQHGRTPRLPVAALNAGPANITRCDPEWMAAHDRALRATALAKHAALPTVIANRPVPRTASCHFFVVDRDRNNVYFY